MKHAAVHTRSQHSKGSSLSKFGGPDTYVAVTISPVDVTVPYCLNRTVLSSRGISIRYFGEGYAEHTGKRSMLYQAIRKAEKFADDFNESQL